MKRIIPFCLIAGFWVLLVLPRVYFERRNVIRSAMSKLAIGSKWDPRGRKQFDEIAFKRESASFRDRLRKGIDKSWTWPGMQAAQVSWNWLELLSGLHNESSYDGNFSWVFSKLHTVINNSPPQETRFVTTLAPFFFVIGKDYAGANVLMTEMLKRVPDQFNPWFWSGFHAMDNLKMNKLASNLFATAALKPGAAEYLSLLSAKLLIDGEHLDSVQRRQILEKSMAPELLEKVKKMRPDYFN